MQPNYHFEDLIRLCDAYDERDLVNPAVIIDTNHSNSGKNPFEQPRIAREVMEYRRHNPQLTGFIKGFLVESYIEDGAQKIGEGVYGKSITDACLGWSKTEELIGELSEY